MKKNRFYYLKYKYKKKSAKCDFQIQLLWKICTKITLKFNYFLRPVHRIQFVIFFFMFVLHVKIHVGNLDAELKIFFSSLSKKINFLIFQE